MGYLQISEAFLRFNHFGAYQEETFASLQCRAENVGVASIFQLQPFA